mgnify:CR=1 FL=1
MRAFDCVLAQGCPIFGVERRGSSDVAKNATPAIVLEGRMIMKGDSAVEMIS